MKTSINPSKIISKKASASMSEKYKDQPLRYAEGASEFDEGMDDFADMLEKAAQEKDDNKTKVIDMKPNLVSGPTDNMSGEEFVEAKQMKKYPPNAPVMFDERVTNLHSPNSPVGKEVAKMQRMGKFKRILGALGKRATKAIPIIGAGLGAASSAEALERGDKVGAALEAASAIDPTPLSDIALAGKDVYEILNEKDNLGEQESPDVELGDNKFDYRNEMERRKKIMGYK
jgi:hypothetical protein